jgi:hypothetical protein
VDVVKGRDEVTSYFLQRQTIYLKSYFALQNKKQRKPDFFSTTNNWYIDNTSTARASLKDSKIREKKKVFEYCINKGMRKCLILRIRLQGMLKTWGKNLDPDHNSARSLDPDPDSAKPGTASAFRESGFEIQYTYILTKMRLRTSNPGFRYQFILSILRPPSLSLLAVFCSPFPACMCRTT